MNLNRNLACRGERPFAPTVSHSVQDRATVWFLLFFVIAGFLLEAGTKSAIASVSFLRKQESICLLLSWIPAYAGMTNPAQDVPVPAQYVEDKSGIIDHKIKERLNAHLKELEQKTGAQVIVLTVNSTEGVPIEQFAFNLASKWQLGQKGKDNGLLIVVAKEDRAYMFEVGYGLESILPDSLCGTLGRKLLDPNFKKGDYGKGIFEATVAIITTIAKENGIEITGIPKLTYTERGPSNSPFLVFLYLLFVIIIIFYILLQRRYYTGRYWWVGPGTFYGGSSLGSFSRPGGFGGGGFGGFGGGGGGSFGGGGASGRW